MKLTTNYGLKKPENTDVVNIEDLNENADIIDKGLVPYIGVTSGSGNTYAITSGNIKNLTIGLAFSIKFNADSTGDCTLNVNSNGAKPIKKANGSTMTSLKASGIYTLRYDGVNFILQGEGASGDAAASDLLSGKTASTDAGDITGTMPNIGPGTAETVDLTTDGAEYTIAKGFHSGLRKIKAKISGLVASIIKAGAKVGGVTGTFTSDANAVAGNILNGKTAYVKGNKVTGAIPDRSTGGHVGSLAYHGQGVVLVNPPKGYYPGNAAFPNMNGYVEVSEPNLRSENIKQGVSIFGINGDLAPGLQYASGVVHTDDIPTTTKIAMGSYNSGSEVEVSGVKMLTINGLSFTPDLIVIATIENKHNTCYVSTGTGNSTWNIVVTDKLKQYIFFTDGIPVEQDIYINSTGFSLPVFDGEYGRVKWIALNTGGILPLG